MTKVYNKLVRDRIPEMIEADGKTCATGILSDDCYLQMLDAKLDEELAEYQESKSLEELADLLEVMQAVVKARGWTWEQLEQARTEKAAKRGVFEKRILLKDVTEKQDGSYKREPMILIQQYLADYLELVLNGDFCELSPN